MLMSWLLLSDIVKKLEYIFGVVTYYIFGHFNVTNVYLDVFKKVFLDNIKFSCQKTLKSIQNYSETILFWSFQ